MELIDEFKEVRECEYKGERYSVRDNGAVMRHPKPGRKPRPTDNVWTFGKRDERTAYMLFGTHRIHIVVATAFHGARDSKVYVVDHIDTNRCNNRPENLRWCTRLENVLGNPITRKRVEFLCGGDIQKFIDNPACLRTDSVLAQGLEWMRTVTPEEARNAKENLEKWAGKPLFRTGENMATPEGPAERDKEWMYKPSRVGSRRVAAPQPSTAVPACVKAISPSVAVQVRWNTPSEFPCCPHEVSDDTLRQYAESLKPGVVFSRNDLWTSIVDEVALIDGGTRLAVATHSEEGLKAAVATVYVKDGLVCHETAGTYFSDVGVRKRMAELQGLAWDGPDCIDDYC